MKTLLMCLAVALLAAGCDNNSGGSPTDPSQVNVEFSTTDLLVGTGAGPAGSGNRATLLFELWLYNPAGVASKGTRIQGSSDPNPQAPGTVIGPISFVIGDRTLIQGFDEGVRGMRVGGKRRMYIPPSLAWGSSGAQGGIPPNASVVFEVELTTLVQ